MRKETFSVWRWVKRNKRKKFKYPTVCGWHFFECVRVVGRARGWHTSHASPLHPSVCSSTSPFHPSLTSQSWWCSSPCRLCQSSCFCSSVRIPKRCMVKGACGGVTSLNTCEDNNDDYVDKAQFSSSLPSYSPLSFNPSLILPFCSTHFTEVWATGRSLAQDQTPTLTVRTHAHTVKTHITHRPHMQKQEMRAHRRDIQLKTPNTVRKTVC